MKSDNFSFNKSLYDMFDELVTYTTLDSEIIDCNEAFLAFINQSKQSILHQDMSQILNITDELSIKEKLLTKEFIKTEEKIIGLNNETYFFATKHQLILTDNEEPRILTIRKDVTDSKVNFVIYKEYKRLLSDIAMGKELINILNALVKSIEKKDPAMLCSILFLDKSGKRLFSAAAPNIPKFFIEKINGMEIGEKVGSCGAAVALKQRVIVEDITTHENWQKAKNLALKANLYACWSQPIFSSKGIVLGTFAIYYLRPKKPTKFELMLIKDAASIAGIALEKHQNEYELAKSYANEKKQEQMLMHKSKQAMMGEMLENIAHQWRQPLSAITAASTGMQLKRELGTDNKDNENSALEDINLNAMYLSQTIEDFRNYFKSDHKFVTFNVKDAFYHTLKLVNARLQTQNVKIIEQLDDIEIHSLENELTQVFMNILNNSIDALNNQNKNERFVRIKIYQDNHDVMIKIIDSAGGVSKEILERIFEPYFTTKHQLQGTGIGLYMCQEIIEKHLEGSIEARNSSFKHKNKEYKGLEFLIMLPIS